MRPTARRSFAELLDVQKKQRERDRHLERGDPPEGKERGGGPKPDPRPRRAVIATPAKYGLNSVHFTHALCQTVRLGLQVGIDIRELFIPDDALVQRARNELLAMVHGDPSFADIVYIDADQDWQPEWVIKLLTYPVDVVGAAVRKKTLNVETYNVRIAGGAMSVTLHPDHPNVPLLTAPDLAVGTGFLRLSRKAFTALWETSEPAGGNPFSKWIFDVRPVDGELVSEDTHICDRLRSQGFEVWVDPEMNPGHHGSMRWQGDFAAFLEKMLAVEAEAASKNAASAARAARDLALSSPTTVYASAQLPGELDT